MHTLDIGPSRLKRGYLKELLRFKRLLYFIPWRDLLLRYKQASLGLLWALLRPFLNMVLFVFVFDRVAHLPSNGISYPLFVMAGMLPYQLVASTLQGATTCLFNNKELITRIYFPRMIFPISAVVVNLVDAIIGFSLLIPWAVFSGYLEVSTLFWVVLPWLQAILLSLALGLWSASLGALYRDLILLVPYVTQILLFLSPVGFSSALVPESYRYVFFLNPLVGIIDGFRFSLFGVTSPYFTEAVLFSWGVVCVLLGTGYLFFKQIEGKMVEIL